MSVPTISVVNFIPELDDEDVQNAIRSVNRQIHEDFAPIWGSIWDLRLHGSEFDPNDIDSLVEEFIQGEGVLYVVDEGHLPGAAGYHAINNRELPYGFVFVSDSSDWTVTLSHEALELIIDPTVNVLVPGPDPRPANPGNTVLHAYEVCDAVERTSYLIDGIRVSNFISQQWFVSGEPVSSRNDFLGVGVPSFDATEDSHLAFFDFDQGWVTYFGTQQADLGVAFEARQRAFSHERKRASAGTEENFSSVVRDLGDMLPKKLASDPAIARLNRLTGLTRGKVREQRKLTTKKDG